MNIPYAHSILQWITSGAVGAVIMWYLGARKHSLEISKLKLEIKRLTEDTDKQARENRTQAICDKIILVAEEHEKDLHPGSVQLFTEHNFVEALKEPLPEVMKALTMLEGQGIADRKFAAGYWRIRV